MIALVESLKLVHKMDIEYKRLTELNIFIDIRIRAKKEKAEIEKSVTLKQGTDFFEFKKLCNQSDLFASFLMKGNMRE